MDENSQSDVAKQAEPAPREIRVVGVDGAMRIVRVDCTECKETHVITDKDAILSFDRIGRLKVKCVCGALLNVEKQREPSRIILPNRGPNRQQRRRDAKDPGAIKLVR